MTLPELSVVKAPPLVYPEQSYPVKTAVPLTVSPPLNLASPSTLSVEVGEAVPMPTRFSFALTIKVEVSTISPPRNVEVAVAEDVFTTK